MSAEAVLKGRSPFADRVGDEIASALITFVDDPTNPEAFSATQTDGEGLATRRNELITGGVLQGFLHNAYTAPAPRRGRRPGLRSGADSRARRRPGARALSLAPGDRSQDELVSSIEHGILVQSVSGLHSGVNPVSGDFSTGAEGLRITNGQVGAPIREFTIASTLQRMLQDVVAIGNDVEWLPMRAAGVTIVVGDVTVSGS